MFKGNPKTKGGGKTAPPHKRKGWVIRQIKVGPETERPPDNDFLVELKPHFGVRIN